MLIASAVSFLHTLLHLVAKSNHHQQVASVCIEYGFIAVPHSGSMLLTLLLLQLPQSKDWKLWFYVMATVSHLVCVNPTRVLVVVVLGPGTLWPN